MAAWHELIVGAINAASAGIDRYHAEKPYELDSNGNYQEVHLIPMTTAEMAAIQQLRQAAQ